MTIKPIPAIGCASKVQCQACHLDDIADKRIDTDCYSCHQADDSHNNQEGKICSDCHNETSWISNVRFDHDLSDFHWLVNTPQLAAKAVT